MLDAALAALGLKKGAVIGGMFGALVSIRFFPPMNLLQAAMTVASGWAVASFTTPLALEALSMGEKHEYGVGFLIGVIGMAVVSNVLKALPDWVASARVKLFGNDTRQNKDGGS